MLLIRLYNGTCDDDSMILHFNNNLERRPKKYFRDTKSHATALIDKDIEST